MQQRTQPDERHSMRPVLSGEALEKPAAMEVETREAAPVATAAASSASSSSDTSEERGGGGGGMGHGRWGERPPCASWRVPAWYYCTIHHWPSRPERGWQSQNSSHIGRLAQEKFECACHHMKPMVVCMRCGCVASGVQARRHHLRSGRQAPRHERRCHRAEPCAGCFRRAPQPP